MICQLECGPDVSIDWETWLGTACTHVKRSRMFYPVLDGAGVLYFEGNGVGMFSRRSPRACRAPGSGENGSLYDKLVIE